MTNENTPIANELDVVAPASHSPAGESRVARDIESLRTGRGVGIYSTIQGDSVDARLASFDAISNSEPLVEHVGEVLPLTDVVIQSVEMLNEQTGELEDAARTVLVCADGKNYHAVSKGVFTALRNLFAIVGEPSTWGKPLNVVAFEQRGRNGYRFLSLKAAPSKK